MRDAWVAKIKVLWAGTVLASLSTGLREAGCSFPKTGLPRLLCRSGLYARSAVG